jgi:disulfide bond formation protein DsbB
MDLYIGILNKILSLGTIFLQIFILFLIINLIFNRENNKFLFFIKKYTFHLGFLSALGAVVLSLFYSEVVGYPPCDLCWIQRLFLYPQLVIFGVELYRKNLSSLDSSLIFAILGSLTSIYHIYVENGGTIGPTCADPSSGGVSCAVRYVYEFGFVTMPLMALTLSLFIIILIINYRIKK